VHRAVLLDADKLGQAPARDARARELAAAATISLVWQRPCHEALLLRHLEGCRDLRRPTSDLSLQELRRRWPDYDKGMPAGRLATRIGANELRRVLQVEHELAAFPCGYRLPRLHVTAKPA
jgi:hypothetical protein